MNIFKSIIPKSSKLYFRLSLVNKIGLKLWLINCLFQRILRRHSRLNFNVNFISTISESNIESNHDFRNRIELAKTFPIIIGDNVWLGVNVIILPGVKIGNGCVVGAGSVVTKTFEEVNLILAGNPAKVIGKVK